jgi:hypothetical protein
MPNLCTSKHKWTREVFIDGEVKSDVEAVYSFQKCAACNARNVLVSYQDGDYTCWIEDGDGKVLEVIE